MSNRLHGKQRSYDFDTWLGSIDEGLKGDVFTLFCLCMQQDVHTTVHLRNDQYWSSMNEPNGDHYVNIEHSHIHLAYLGRGLYIELVERDVPLQIITGASKDLGVLGSLKSEELSILDSTMYQGLGVGLDGTASLDMLQQAKVKTEHSPKPSTSSKPTISADPNLSAEPSTPTMLPQPLTIPGQTSVMLQSAEVRSHHSPSKIHKSLSVSINKINLQEGVRVKVTADMLAKLPKPVLHDGSSTERYEST